VAAGALVAEAEAADPTTDPTTSNTASAAPAVA